jgi:hypothetical protein
MLSVPSTEDPEEPLFHWNDPFYGLFLACCVAYICIFIINLRSDIINIDESQDEINRIIEEYKEEEENKQ